MRCLNPLQHEELLRIAVSAHHLEEWLHKNTGTNDDWPVGIKTDKEGGEKLAQLLTELCTALKPFRNPVEEPNPFNN